MSVNRDLAKKLIAAEQRIAELERQLREKRTPGIPRTIIEKGIPGVIVLQQGDHLDRYKSTVVLLSYNRARLTVTEGPLSIPLDGATLDVGMVPDAIWNEVCSRIRAHAERAEFSTVVDDQGVPPGTN